MKNTLFLSVLFSTTLAAQENSLSHELLSMSLKRFNSSEFSSQQAIQSVSPWLAGLPSVQLSLLQSSRSTGADEYEVSINLPFKTRLRKDLDKQMFSNTSALNHLVDQNKALLLSGLIRESIWNYHLASKQKQIEQQKSDWLSKQQKYVQQMLASGDNSRLELLFIEQALFDAELKVLEFNQKITNNFNQFKQITGIEHIPDNLKEMPVLNENQAFRKHPRVLQIQSQIEQSTLSFQLIGKAADPINISLIAKEISAIGAGDQQFGVAVELPIGRKSNSQLDSSSWLQNQNKLSNELIGLEQSFKREFSTLRSKQHYLAQKQKLLEKQSHNNKEIFSSLEQLRNNNELNQGLFFQRMINLIDAMNQSELNQIYVYQNNSRQNQLAGVLL